jgi:hypothetical protein
MEAWRSSVSDGGSCYGSCKRADRRHVTLTFFFAAAASSSYCNSWLMFSPLSTTSERLTRNQSETRDSYLLLRRSRRIVILQVDSCLVYWAWEERGWLILSMQTKVFCFRLSSTVEILQRNASSCTLVPYSVCARWFLIFKSLCSHIWQLATYRVC